MKKTIVINSIFGGWQPSYYFGKASDGQFLSSIGIDPDVPLTDAATNPFTSGVLRPVKYAKFSGSAVNSHAVALLTNPKDTKTYAILRNGKIVSYDSALGTETTVGTVAGNQASGGFYYNNYVYALGTGASHDDVSRYGPLDNSPALTDNVWKGATLGSLTALTDTTYPTTRNSVQYLNHAHHVHVDNKAYFLDFKNGQGYVHYIKTTRTTNEGDTNSGSTYGSPSGAALLPFNMLPMCISGYGNSLAIGASQGTSATVFQGGSKIYLWDTTSTTFYQIINVPDPLITALWEANGVLYGISGSPAGGVRLFRYVGGSSIQTLAYIGEGNPPLQNAIRAFGNRIVWGGFQTYPDNAAVLMAYGSKSDLFPRGLHSIAVSSLTASASNGVITALAMQASESAFPKFICAGTDGTNTNIDKQSSTYGTHYWWSPVFNVGRGFTVKRISLRLGAAVAANMTITPKLFMDDESKSQAGTVINNTNFPNSERFVPLTEDSFSGNSHGRNNFFLELKWTGTALLPVLLPIVIELDLDGDPNQ